MSASLQPIKVWGKGGPNPPKVSIILEELNIPYEINAIDFSAVKGPEFLAINPNGRIPAIQDPNSGLTLWESGAIVAYLIEQYDTKHQLSFAPGSIESYLAKQWLYFQVSGQGPYYGQAVWFSKYHPEQLPTARERYVKEINRVSDVLNRHLAQQKQEHGSGDGPWLVGNKLSYTDIAFVPWQILVTMILDKDQYDEDKFQHVKGWIGKMVTLKSVKSVLENAQPPFKYPGLETKA